MDAAREAYASVDREQTDDLWSVLPPKEVYLPIIQKSRMRFYYVTELGKLSGGVIVMGDEILGFFTREKRRGHGVGRYMIDEVKKIHPGRLYVHSEKNAVGFYEKCGFSVRPDIDPDDGIYMVYREDEKSTA